MAEYQILFWRDIPAQIKVFEKGRRPVSRELPSGFQLRIDAVAMKEGLIGTDEYINQWHWSPKLQRDGTAEEIAEAVLNELAQQRVDDH
jgi:hypothetical protein